MHSLPGPQLDNVSPSGFVYHQCARFIRRNEFHHVGGKSGGSGQDKSEEERDFHWMQWGRHCFGPGKIGSRVSRKEKWPFSMIRSKGRCFRIEPFILSVRYT